MGKCAEPTCRFPPLRLSHHGAAAWGSKNDRLVPSDYRIVILLEMHIPSICKNLAIRYTSWYRGNDSIYCDISQYCKARWCIKIFWAGPQRASPTNAKVCHWVSEWWSYRIGQPTVGVSSLVVALSKWKGGEQLLCLRFLGSVSAVQCNIT